MHCRLNEMDSKRIEGFPKNTDFAFWGVFKYLTAVILSSVTAFILFGLSVSAVPAAIFIFYLTEMFFLFLFPLLIDGCRNPFRENLRMLKKTGFFRSYFCLLTIAIYMISGIFSLSDPSRRWKIGCIAVLVWYSEIKQSRQTDQFFLC